METDRWPSGGVESKGKREAFPHLRSLSTYSRRILCDNTDSLPSFGQSLSAATPFCNIKIEIVNSEASRSGKRCLDDPSVEGECGPPARKRMALGATAPDSGSALDAPGDFLGKSKVPGSYTKPQKPTMIRKVGGGKPLRSAATLPKLGSAKPDGVAPGVLSHVKVEDGVSTLSQIPTLNSKCLPLKAGSPAQPGQESPLEFDISHAFDFDIEEILSLSPIYSGASDDSEGIEAFIESCHSFYESSQAQSPTSCHVQGAEPAGGVGEASRKEALSLDEGYFSRSYREALQGGSGGVGQLPKISPLHSSPLTLGVGIESSNREQAAGGVGGALQSPAPLAEPFVCRNLLSILDDTPKAEPTGLRQGAEGGGQEAGFREEAGFHWEGVELKVETRYEEAKVDCKEEAGFCGKAAGFSRGEAGFTTEEAGSATGPPRLESSVRRGSFSKNDEADEKTDSAPHQDTTGVFCESTDASFNDTILPPVQVRSVVVVPQRRVEPEDVKGTLKHLKRPVVFESESDWQREKDLYVAAVSSHMANSAPSGGGVMSELVNLMRTVAGQGNTNRKQEPWQHPSDLTRRNYKIPSGKAKISLDEWQKRNRKTFCRFAGLPAKFKRSPIL